MPPRVGLFITCLVDLMRPSVGFAAARLIEAAGCEVDVPLQTCCGQPAYNSGDRADAREIALATMAAFRGYDYIVVPSGSCAAMLRVHYPRLFAGEGCAENDAKAFGERVYELTSFLTDVRGLTIQDVHFHGRVAYHDSCSGLRELGVKAQPRRLLSLIEGANVVELSEPEACCGFGGLFCMSYPRISDAITTRKVSDIMSTEADVLAAGDLGCLFTIAGKLSRLGSKVQCRHIAEILTGDLSAAPIGGKAKGNDQQGCA